MLNNLIFIKLMNITPMQIRAARTLLGWTTHDLAKFSNLSISTINNIENERHNTHTKTLEKIYETFEKFGVCYVESCGVLLNSTIKIFEGLSGIAKYFDYLYETLKATSSDYKVFTTDELIIKHKLGKALQKHIKDIADLSNVSVKIFAPKGSFEDLNKYTNFQIKQIPGYGRPLSAYCYFAGHTAIFFLADKVKIVVMQDQPAFELAVQNFDYIWNNIR